MVKVGLSLKPRRTDVDAAPAAMPQVELDLERLSQKDLAILLANLRRSGRAQLAEAIARELDFAATAPGSRPDDRPPGRERETRAGGANWKRAATAGAGVLAAFGMIALMVAPELTTRRAPATPAETWRPAQDALRAPATETASIPAGRTERSTGPVRRAAPAAAVPPPGAPLRAATPSTPVRVAPVVVAEAVEPVEAPPERIALPAIDAVDLAAAPEPPASGPAAPPIVVSQGDLGRILGRAPQRSDPLRSLQSGNPVRMAAAVSAAR